MSDEQITLVLSRKELLIQHDNLIAQIHQLRRWLKLPQLMTGHQRREVERNADSPSSVHQILSK